MPRERLRDYDRETRLTHEARLLGNPGATGRAKIGGAGRGGGAVSSGPGVGAGRGTDIHHITLGAVTGQTIAAGGATVQWGTVAGAPTEVRGFPTALQTLADDGVIGAIPIDLRGLCRVRVVLPFEAEVTGTTTITLTRDGVTRTILTEAGTGDTYEAAPMCWVRPDDTIAVTVDPDDDATLSSDGDRQAVIEVSIWDHASPTSDATVPTVASLGDFNEAEDGDGDVIVGRPDDVAAGDVLVAFVTGNLGDGLGVTWPDGFTSVGSAETSTHVAAAVKEATGSEPANYTFTWMESFGGISAVVAVVHGGDIDAVGADSESGSDSITVGPLSPTVGVCLIGVAGGGEVADATLLTSSLGAEIWVGDGGAARDVVDPGALAAVAVIVGGG